MQCDMCGTEGSLFKANVEGALLTVCNNCGKYGKVIERVRPEEPAKKLKKRQQIARRVSQEENIFVIVQGYSNKIKNKRERLGLKQTELAKKLNERESLISKVESGGFEPSIKLARKLEKFLKIQLVEEHKESTKVITQHKPGDVTIGDLVKLKKR